MIGPKAQAILTPFLKFDADACLFSPKDAEAERNANRRTKSKHATATQNPAPHGRKGERYTVASYRRAIARACRKAQVALHKALREAGQEIKPEHSIPAWSPNQLRHNAATRLREQFGIEAARVVLGHKSAEMTEVYAERDTKQAEEIMAKVGVRLPH